MACSAELMALPPAVALSDVVLRYPGQPQPALRIERWQVAAGERVAVLGPSGSGKTSLLRLLNGSLQPEQGSVALLGAPLPARGRARRLARRRIGMVFQNFALIERATVWHNVLYGRLGHAHPWWSLLGRFSEADRQLAYDAIGEVGLLAKLQARVDSLSGGQRQRVAVARVLAQEPALILADEPVNNLDPKLVLEILDLLVAASSRRGATLIMSLHQPELARAYAARIVALAGGSVAWDAPAGQLTAPLLARIYGESAADAA